MEKDEYDSLPVLEALPKAQPPTPLYVSLPSMMLKLMFKMWPLCLLLVGTFWDEVVSLICQANMATVVSWAWNLLPKPDLTGLAEYAINQKLTVGFYSAPMFWKLQTLLVRRRWMLQEWVPLVLDFWCCVNVWLYVTAVLASYR